MKVLIVEDSKTLRRLVKRTVEALKFECCEANNPNEALEILEKDHMQISLILLDWNMPEMSGIDFLDILKKIKKYKDIPVIMITCQSTKDHVLMAVNKGAIGYIIKPFSQLDLTNKIQLTLIYRP